VSPDPGPFKLGDVGGGGPAVLCLHGLTGTPFEVRPPAEALVEADFACLGPLLPGHGTHPRDLEEVERAAWLEAALGAWDELARTHVRVYALGLSMGGLLALALCVHRPVAGAVLIGTPLDLGLRVRAGIWLLRRWIRWLPKTPSILDPAARARHPGYRRMPLGAVRQLILLQRELYQRLPEVRVPLQLIFSRRDPTVALADAQRILAAVSSTENEVLYLENSGHVSPVDREGERLAAAVVEFLSGLERRASG
jgi:carboxylesterase